MSVLLIKRLLRLVGRWARKPINHTSWVAVVTPTDRPKSVRNRCVIELFVALFVLSLCPFDISVGVGAFVIGLSQISSFFSWNVQGQGHGQRTQWVELIKVYLRVKFERGIVNGYSAMNLNAITDLTLKLENFKVKVTKVTMGRTRQGLSTGKV